MCGQMCGGGSLSLTANLSCSLSERNITPHLRTHFLRHGSTAFENSSTQSWLNLNLSLAPVSLILSPVCTQLVCWRDSPAAMLTLALMCGGDGLADIVGRRFGSAKLPYNSGKSWAGSAAMFGGGSVMALG